ncbi:MAG: TRL domain-containing protein, partial [Candidatus Omnitrophica bacterium]|nr:TRL domain-containing protein [Candidatus Omnitrophota bacterium]
TAKSTSILGLVATGDSSIKTAASNGGIKTIKYVDYDAKNILGIYGEYTTTVYGD